MLDIMVIIDVIKSVVQLVCCVLLFYNSQFWCWIVEDYMVVLFFDKDWVFYVIDYFGWEVLLGCGVVFDYFWVVMVVVGIIVNVEWFFNFNDFLYLVLIDFSLVDFVIEGYCLRVDVILLCCIDWLFFVELLDWDLVELQLCMIVIVDMVCIDVIVDDMCFELVVVFKFIELLWFYDLLCYVEFFWWIGVFEIFEGILYSLLVLVVESDWVIFGCDFLVVVNIDRCLEFGYDCFKVLVFFIYDNECVSLLCCGEMFFVVLFDVIMVGFVICMLIYIIELYVS